MRPFSGNQRPDLLTALMNMSLVLHLPRKMHLCRSSSNVPRLPSFLEMLHARFAHFWQGAQSLAPATRNDISTSKSCANMWCFSHFEFEMCFAPQRRALFRHLNVQKWSENGVLCTFWLRHVLRAKTACALFRHLNFQKCFEREVFLAFSLANALLATMACTFSTSQLPKVVRSCCVFVHLTSKCASHHNGAQFFISHLARWLRTRSFSEPTFRPSGATNHWKNTAFRDFPTFSRTWIFFLLTLSLLWSSVFYSSLLSDSPFPSLLFICPFVGILISKLPSIIVLLKSHSVQGMDYTSIAGPDVRDSQALDWWKAQANCRGRNYWTKQLNFLLQIHCTLGKW